MLKRTTVKGLRDIQWAALRRLVDSDPRVRLHARTQVEVITHEIASRTGIRFRTEQVEWLERQNIEI